MALTDDEHALVTSLDRELSLNRKKILNYDRYLEGEQALKYMAPQLEAEVGDLVTQMVINWPWLCVDAYETRLDIRGFRYAGTSDRDPQILEWWDTVDGEEQSQLAHFEGLGLGRCYAIVGAGDEDDEMPVLTIEHPLQVITRRDPRTRDTSCALHRWKDDDGIQWGELFTPEETITIVKHGRGWVDEERDEHNFGVVSVVPIRNRPRILRHHGRSLFHDIIPVADAANKMATDMMVSGEFHAMPRRWAIGMDEDDFVDAHGNQMSTWSAVQGHLWSTSKAPDEVAVGQFPESDLANFHATIKLLAQMVGHLVGLPEDYLSFTSDNPSSADAIRASEARLVKKAERMQTSFGTAWEEVARLFLRYQDPNGDLPAKANSLKTVWIDPATPTKAQQADAVVKLVAAKVLPVEFAREELGYDDEQRRRMQEADDSAAARSLSLLAGAGGDPGGG